jgi:hypothetical protein
LAQVLFPKQSMQWSKGENRGWRRPFVVRANHPEWGAQAAAACGSSAITVELIRRHQKVAEKNMESDLKERLALLQWADNRN